MKLVKYGSSLEVIASGRNRLFMEKSALLIFKSWKGKQKIRLADGVLSLEKKGHVSLASLLPTISVLEMGRVSFGVERLPKTKKKKKVK